MYNWFYGNLLNNKSPKCRVANFMLLWGNLSAFPFNRQTIGLLFWLCSIAYFLLKMFLWALPLECHRITQEMVNGLHLYSTFIQSAVQFMPLIHPFTHTFTHQLLSPALNHMLSSVLLHSGNRRTRTRNHLSCWWRPLMSERRKRPLTSWYDSGKVS